MAVMKPNTGRLAGLVGRSGEAVKVRGMFLHPNQLRQAQTLFEGIKKLQAVVTREGSRDKVTLLIIKTDGVDIDASKVKQTLQTLGRLTVDDVQVVEQIEGSRLIRDDRRWD
jgi:phenylacetate-CoA ligase